MSGEAKFNQQDAVRKILEGNAPRANTEVGHETKKRVSIVVYPSKYSDLQKIAYVDRKPVSAIVSKLIADYVDANSEKLEEYKKIIAEQEV